MPLTDKMSLMKNEIREMLAPADAMVEQEVNTDYPILTWLNERFDELLLAEPNPDVRQYYASMRRVMFGVLNRDDYYRNAMSFFMHLITTGPPPPIHGPRSSVWKTRYGVK